MNTTRTALLSSLGALAVTTAGHATGPFHYDTGAVFVMTNDAGANEVIAYDRNPYGTLYSPQRYRTNGRGSGGRGDPLASQGSLTLSQDHEWLFAVNAGSGTVSVFHVDGARLALVDVEPTSGAEPVSVTQHGSLVYVLNAGGSSSLTGFFFSFGRLTPIPGSTRFLSANVANPGSAAFSADGRFVLATEKAGNSIDVFSVLRNGTLSDISVNPSIGPGAFAAAVAPGGTVVVSETGSGGATSAVSSYSLQADGTLAPISVSVPTLGAANCWNVFTPDGRIVYVSNAATASLSGFRISGTGVLTALPGTVVGTNPSGSLNLDIAISADGRYLYTLNSGAGAIGQFGINTDGSLTNLGTAGGLPAGSSLNGIAAN